MIRALVAGSIVFVASVANADSVPVEVKSPPGKSVTIEVRPRGALRDQPAPPEWTCATPCTIALPRGHAYELTVRGTEDFASTRKRIDVLEGPLVATIDPAGPSARWWTFGLAVGASAGLAVSAVLLASESLRTDESGHDGRARGFAASFIAHGILSFVAWPIAIHNRTSIEVHRSFPAVAVTPRSASLTWTF